MPDDASTSHAPNSMSSAHLQDETIAVKYKDRVSSLRRRSSRLRALNNVTAALTQHVGLPSALSLDFDADPLPPLSIAESRFLDDNDVTKGRYFRPETLDIRRDTLLKTFQSRKIRNVSNSQSTPKNNEDAEHAKSVDHQRAAQDLFETGSQNKSKSNDSEFAGNLTSTGKQQLPSEDPAKQAPGHADHDTSMLDVHLQGDNESSPSSAAVTRSVTTVAPAAPSSHTSADGYIQPARATRGKADEAGLRKHIESTSDVLGSVAAVESRDTADAQIHQEHEHGLLPPGNSALNLSLERLANATRNTPTLQGSIDTHREVLQEVSSNDASKDVRKRSEAHSESRHEGSIRHGKSLHDFVNSGAPSSLSDMRKTTPLESRALRIRTHDVLARADSSYLSFPRPAEVPQLPALPPDLAKGYDDLQGAAADNQRDYLETLYRYQAQDPLKGKSISELLQRATKVVCTEDQLSGTRERLEHRVLKRIFALQCNGKWSLRQTESCPEPVPLKTHVDHMLSEMKWMRTDFRAERKMKRSLAKYLAELCAEWINADVTQRQQMQCCRTSAQTRRRLSIADKHKADHDSPHSPANTTIGMSDTQLSGRDDLPELEPSTHATESQSDDTTMPSTPVFAVIPESLLEVKYLSDSFLVREQADYLYKSLSTLPLLRPFDDADSTISYEVSQAPVTSVSKFHDAKILANVSEPKVKRSRYDYETEDGEAGVTGSEYAIKRKKTLPPEQKDVALFSAEFQHIRDRLNVNGVFRPPSEFPMPATQFYEFRSASQWTLEDDQKVKELAKDYCFNWSLIAADMALPSDLHGAPDRRTPWECFERWVELESLPNSVKSTVYFRTWGQRLEAALRNVDARYQAQVAAQGQNSAGAPVPMRRKIQPMSVDKRRSSRHLHMIDAMRKLVRKREQQQHKQIEAQKAASLRKQQETVQPRATMHTPQEFSRIRHDRDVQLAARQEKYREQVLAQQKAAQMHRNGQYANHQQAMAAAQQQQRAITTGTTQMHPGQPGNAQGLPGQPMTGNMGHNLAVPPHLANAQFRPRPGIPGAAQAGAYAQEYGRPNSAQRLGQPYGLPAQQQQQRRPSPNGMVGNAMMNGQHPMSVPMQNTQSNGSQAPMMQRNLSGHSNAASSQGVSASPSMRPPPVPGTGLSQLSSGMVPAIAQIKASLQAQHPQATPMQIDQMAAEQMKRQYQSAQRQSAMAAASGGHAPGIGRPGGAYPQPAAGFPRNPGMPYPQQSNGHPTLGGIGNATSPQQQQQYAALLRQRQLQQQQAQQLAAAQRANGIVTVGVNSSPQMQQGSPQHQAAAAMHASPNMAQAVPNMLGVSNALANKQQGPSSRSATPQMAGVGSLNGVVVGSPSKPVAANIPQMSPQAGSQTQSQAQGQTQASLSAPVQRTPTPQQQ